MSQTDLLFGLTARTVTVVYSQLFSLVEWGALCTRYWQPCCIVLKNSHAREQAKKLIADCPRLVLTSASRFVRHTVRTRMTAKYELAILDDFSGRSIDQDLSLGLLLLMLRSQPQMRILVSVQSLDCARQVLLLCGKHKVSCGSISPPRPASSLTVRYLTANSPNYIVSALETVSAIHQSQDAGDVLVFLSGQQDIQLMARLLSHKTWSTKGRLKVVKVYPSSVGFINSATGQQRVYLASQFAEDIVIPGVVYVVDCGLVKVRMGQHPFDSLVAVPTSRHSAWRRAAKATLGGKCFRLYTQQVYQEMSSEALPQIKRADLSTCLLVLAQLGLYPIDFPFVTPPQRSALRAAAQSLFWAEAIDLKGSTSWRGKVAASLPLSSKLGLLVASSCEQRFGCSEQAIKIACMLQQKSNLYFAEGALSVLKAKKRVGAKEGDHFCLHNFLALYDSKRGALSQLKLNYSVLQKAKRLQGEIIKVLLQLKVELPPGVELSIRSSIDDPEPIMRAILASSFTRIAQLQGDGSYRSPLLPGRTVYLHPQSVLNLVSPKWVCFDKVTIGEKLYITQVCEIYPEWLFELAGNYYSDTREEQALSRHEQEVARRQQAERVFTPFTDVFIRKRRKDVPKVQVSQGGHTKLSFEQF